MSSFPIVNSSTKATAAESHNRLPNRNNNLVLSSSCAPDCQWIHESGEGLGLGYDGKAKITTNVAIIIYISYEEEIKL